MSKHKTSVPDVATSNHEPAPGTPPTYRLLAAAKRARDYKKEGRGCTRQLDVRLRGTPPSDVYFRTWPDPDADYEIGILKVKDDQDRKQVYILHPDVADLPHIAKRVRDGHLVAGVTAAGRVFVWARVEPDPNDRLCYKMYEGLRKIGEEARTRWVAISWDNGALSCSYPRTPIEHEPQWPSGQPLDEVYELALHDAFISDPEHPVIRQLDGIKREV